MNRSKEDDLGVPTVECLYCGEEILFGEVIVETDEGAACDDCSRVFGTEEPT